MYVCGIISGTVQGTNGTHDFRMVSTNVDIIILFLLQMLILICNKHLCITVANIPYSWSNVAVTRSTHDTDIPHLP